MHWGLLTLAVCSFGFFKDLRPSEAYLTSYLTGSWKNLTEEQVDNEIYPWWTYSYLLWIVPVFLLTDFLRYKPMLVLDGLAYIATWVLLLWAQGVPAMKGMQVTYGLATAGEIGYYSYLYVMVSRTHFTKVTSFTRAASLTGKFVAYLIGQLFVSFEVTDLFGLNIISFVCVSFAFLIAIFLPHAKYSEIFNRTESVESVEIDNVSQAESPDAENEAKLPAPRKGILQTLRDGFVFLVGELKEVYSSKTVVLWSVWWAFASCGNFQVGNYIQNLWKTVAPHKPQRHIYNGAVEAAGTLLGSLSVLAIGYVTVDWSSRGRGESLIAAVCGLNVAVLIIMAKSTEIWLVYVLYDIFRATYQIVVTIATASIARAMTRQRYGFVFGCNTFLALVIETILTAIVVDESGLGVDIRTQFLVYGGYFAVMTGVFWLVALYRCRSMIAARDLEQLDTSVTDETSPLIQTD